MLRNSFFSLLLLLFGAFQQLNAQVTSMFIDANKYYENQDYQAAYRLYDSIEKMNYNSPELFFNKANAAYKLDSFVMAILYFEKALKLNPSMIEANKNLELANKKLFEGKLPNPIKSVSHWISQFFNGNFELLALIATIFSLLISLLLVIKIATKKSPKTRIIPLVNALSIIGFLVTISLAFVIYNYSVNQNSAIVFDNDTKIMNEPSINSNFIFKIERGGKITILEENNEWYKIEYNSKIGWVKKENVVII